MRNSYRFTILAGLTLLSVAPLAGQCQPQMIVSVYSDGSVSADGSTVYGYSTTTDTSTLCGCVHSNYQTTAELIPPSGSDVKSTQSGEAATVMMSTNGVHGTYYAIGTVSLNCSCAGLVYGGGPSNPINPPPPTITGIADNSTGSNTIYTGDSGYLAIYGSALTAWGQTPTPTVTGDGDVNLSTYWASDTQVDASYTVAAQATTGQHTLALQTKSGTAKSTYYVGPKITGPNTVWWFNGQSPSGYATSITLTSSGGSSTVWRISQGGGKVGLSTFSGAQTTVTSTGNGFSAQAGDIQIIATANSTDSKPFSITSREPASLFRVSALTGCDATYGYLTNISYSILDQLESALPSNVPANEQWTTDVKADYAGTNWRRRDPNGFTTAGSYFTDQIGGEVAGKIPAATCDGNSTPVEHWGQQWSIGSGTPGVGVSVQNDTLQKYIGYANHI
jgi:hypothetical protein